MHVISTWKFQHGSFNMFPCMWPLKSSQGAFIYITATFNYHQHLYKRRGGKTIIRATSLQLSMWTCMHNIYPCHPCEDWAKVQAARLRAMCSALHRLAGKTEHSRLCHKCVCWHGMWFGHGIITPATLGRSPMVAVLKRVYLHFRLMALTSAWCILK